jgi:hypothetical protein
MSRRTNKAYIPIHQDVRGRFYRQERMCCQHQGILWSGQTIQRSSTVLLQLGPMLAATEMVVSHEGRPRGSCIQTHERDLQCSILLLCNVWEGQGASVQDAELLVQAEIAMQGGLPVVMVVVMRRLGDSGEDNEEGWSSGVFLAYDRN